MDQEGEIRRRFSSGERAHMKSTPAFYKSESILLIYPMNRRAGFPMNKPNHLFEDEDCLKKQALKRLAFVKSKPSMESS